MSGRNSKLSGFSIWATSGLALRITVAVCGPPISVTLTTIRGRGCADRTYTVRVALEPRGTRTSTCRQSVPATHALPLTLGSSGRNEARPPGSPGWFAIANRYRRSCGVRFCAKTTYARSTEPVGFDPDGVPTTSPGSVAAA
jgi:hypothetical protein